MSFRHIGVTKPYFIIVIGYKSTRFLCDNQNKFMFNPANLKKIDSAMIASILILCIIGAANVFSTTYFPDKVPSKLFFNQILFYVIGLVIYFVITTIDYKKLFNWGSNLIIFLTTIALLIAVLVFGDYVFEARRWISIGPFTMQPSEFAKVVIILIASFSFSIQIKREFERVRDIYRSKKKEKARLQEIVSNKFFAKTSFSFIALASIIFLVMAQKSLGNSVIIILIFSSIVFMALDLNLKLLGYIAVVALGLNASFGFLNFRFVYEAAGILDSIKIDFVLLAISIITILLLVRFTQIKLGFSLALFAILLLANPFLTFVYNDLLLPYQRNRIETFISPDPKEALSDNYNKEQAMLAIGSGGFAGTGFLNGTVTNLGLLPFAFTDFAFAGYAEQFGFVGTLFLFCLYLFLLLKIFGIAKSTKDKYGRLIAGGVGIMIALNCIQHIGMNLGVLPITGVPLPLISYGGSAVLTIFIGLGLVQAVKIKGEEDEIDLIDLKKEMNI